MRNRMRNRNEILSDVQNDDNTLFDIHMYCLLGDNIFFASQSTTKNSDDIGELCKFFNLKEKLQTENPMGNIAEFLTRRYRFEGYQKAWDNFLAKKY